MGKKTKSMKSTASRLRKLCKGPVYINCTQFKEVHLSFNGIENICSVITIDGVEEHYSWDIGRNRTMIRAKCIDDVKVTVDPNVTKGWDYGI